MRVLALLVACLTAAGPVQAAGLTSPEPLAKAYELILNAQFDEADGALRQACGPAPAMACQVLQAVSQYWQLQFDPENTAHDAAALAKTNTAIASGEAWVGREPGR